MNIYRLFHTPAVWLCALLGMAVTSCITDDTATPTPVQGPVAEENVIINLQLPTQAVPGTRTAAQTRSQEGDQVKDLWVLAFVADSTFHETTEEGKSDMVTKKEVFHYCVTATKHTEQKWEAKLQLLDGRQQTFLMIANVGGQGGQLEQDLEAAIAAAEKTPTTKAELMQAIYAGDEEGQTQLDATQCAPMCGQTMITAIYSGSGQELGVKMHRMTARLNFYVGDMEGTGIKGFTLQSISLYNMQGLGIVMPTQMSPEFAGPVDSVSLPDRQGTNGIDIPVRDRPFTFNVSGNKVENQIYVYETGQPDKHTFDNTPVFGDSKSYKPYRPCIVIGGTWKGGKHPTETRFWRIDFKDDPTLDTKEAYIDLLRNFSYSFTLVNVRQDGADRESAALVATSANDLEVKTLAMDEYQVSNVAFDGTNFLGIENKSYLINRHGSGNTDKKIFTQELTTTTPWKAELIDLDADGNENGKSVWVEFVKPDTPQEPTITSGEAGEKQSVGFYVNGWDPSEEKNDTTRTALMRFTAGNLLVEATIVQDASYEVTLRVKTYNNSGNHWNQIDGNDGYVLRFDSTGTLLTPIEVEYGPQNVTLEWALTTDSIKSTVMNGKAVAAGSGSTQWITEGMEAEDLTAEGRYPYASFEGTLMVVAKLGRITKSLSIPVRQTRYGVILNANDTYQPLSTSMSFGTQSNFDWTASIVETAPFFVNSLASNTGKKGYSTTTLNTNDLSENLDIKNQTLTICYTDPTGKYKTYKNIKFESGITLNGQQMDIIYGGNLSIWEMSNRPSYILPDGRKATLPDKRVGLFLAKHYNQTIFYEGSVDGIYEFAGQGNTIGRPSGRISRYGNTLLTIAATYAMSMENTTTKSLYVWTCSPENPNKVTDKAFWSVRGHARWKRNNYGLYYQGNAFSPQVRLNINGWASEKTKYAAVLSFGFPYIDFNRYVYERGKHYHEWTYDGWAGIGKAGDHSYFVYDTYEGQDFTGKYIKVDYKYSNEMWADIWYLTKKSPGQAAREFRLPTYYLAPKR